MNEQPPFFIVRPFLFLPLIFFLTCSNPSEQGTGKKEKKIGQGTGKVEKKEKKKDIQGRIKTLQEKFAEFREDPPELSERSRKRWIRQCEKSDSLLNNKLEELKSLEEGAEKQRFFQDLDRMLQRIATQAQGMERAYEGKKSTHP